MGVASDEPIDDYSDLPLLMRTVAQMALIEGSNSAAIVTELKQIHELAKSKPDEARTRMTQFIGGQ